MTLLERISQIDKKFAWSFLGVLLAVFGFWYSRDNPAGLRIELLSRARVYDIHADVPKLAILFDGENIKEKKQVLSFYTVRVSNPGGKPITQNLYDTSLSFGLRIFNARAFPPELVDASQKYLTENLKPTLGDRNTIMFEKVVIDAGAAFTIRFLVLHAEGLDPLLQPVGKIAGVGSDDLTVTEALLTEAQPSFWRSLMMGSPLVHIVRFLGYIVLIIGIALSIGLPAAAFGEMRARRKMKKIAARFKMYQGAGPAGHADTLAGIAVEEGEKGLILASRLDGLGVSQKRLQSLLEGRPYSEAQMRLEMESPFFFTLPTISKLKEAKVLSEENGTIRLDQGFKKELDDFQVFWRATEPSPDIRSADRFVARAIQEIKDRHARSEASLGDASLTADAGCEPPSPGAS